MTDSERIAALEQQVANLTAIIQSNGNIRTPGNVYLIDPREPSNPTKLYMGPSDDIGFYIYSQERFPGQGSKYWAGMETFERVNPQKPAAGYGFHPLRLWGKNNLWEANGTQVGVSIVAQRIYLQEPLHIDPMTGDKVKADHYDDFGTPYTSDGRELGGIYWNKNDLGHRIERIGDKVMLFTPQGEKEL